MPWGDEDMHLIGAAAAGDLDEVKRLIENGANVNTKDGFGNTPLHIAAHKGDLNVVKILVENGADINAKNEFGWTPLHHAAYKGHFDIVAFLVEHGADINAKNNEGDTPLHWAVSEGYLDVVEFLVENGADVNARNKYGWTPLHQAASKGYLDVAKILVENGADVNAKDEAGLTPLHYAVSGGHFDVVKFLVENGADVNAKDKNGNTPLHLAVTRSDHLDVAEFLVENGADINAKNNDGKTPLDVASPKVKWRLEKLIKRARGRANQQRVGESPVQKPINATESGVKSEPARPLLPPSPPPPVGGGLVQEDLCRALCRVYSLINGFLVLFDHEPTDKDLQDLLKDLIRVRGHVEGIRKHLLEVHDIEGARIMNELHGMLVHIIELINVAQPDKINEAKLSNELEEIRGYVEPKIKNLKCECKQ